MSNDERIQTAQEFLKHETVLGAALQIQNHDAETARLLIQEVCIQGLLHPEWSQKAVDIDNAFSMIT